MKRFAALLLAILGIASPAVNGEELRWFKLSLPMPPARSFSFITPPPPDQSGEWFRVTDLPTAIGNYAIALPCATTNSTGNPLLESQESDWTKWSVERLDRWTIKIVGPSYSRTWSVLSPRWILIMDTAIFDLFGGGLDHFVNVPRTNDCRFSVLTPQIHARYWR